MATLVKSANQLGHRLINALVHSFLLAVCGERQLLAENLHAAEMCFERLNEWVLTHLNHSAGLMSPVHMAHNDGISEERRRELQELSLT